MVAKRGTKKSEDGAGIDNVTSIGKAPEAPTAPPAEQAKGGNGKGGARVEPQGNQSDGTEFVLRIEASQADIDSQAPAAIGHIEGMDELKGKAKKRADARKKAARRKWLKAQVILECERRGWHVSANDNRADGLGIMNHLMVKECPEIAIGATPLFEGSAG